MRVTRLRHIDIGSAVARSALARSSAVLRRGVRHWGRGALDLLFPPACASCGCELPGDEGNAPTAERPEILLCEACTRRLTDAPGPACPRCAARVATLIDGSGCHACHNRRLSFSSAVALGFYGEELRKTVLRTKHMQHYPLAFALAQLLWRQCGEQLAALKCDAVAAVPMHWTRRLLRGTNAPDILCERLAKNLRIPSAPNLLVRRRKTLPQADLAQGRRRANLRRAFRVRASYALDGARILLVDDILTTGATANEAAAALRAAGAADVAVAVLARSDRPIGSLRRPRLKTAEVSE